jgi:hypothetical protein
MKGLSTHSNDVCVGVLKSKTSPRRDGLTDLAEI